MGFVRGAISLEDEDMVVVVVVVEGIHVNRGNKS